MTRKSYQTKETKSQRLFDKTSRVAQKILKAFEDGQVPTALATVYLHSKVDIPCREWSYLNRMIVALDSHSDARGFRQWERVGRRVKKGEKASYILAPCMKKVAKNDLDKESDRQSTEEEIELLAGFRPIPVFGYNQTEGAPLSYLTQADNWIKSLPFVDVAKEWGLAVSTYSGTGGMPLGTYQVGQKISLGVQNLSTFTHELIHAADDRLGNLQKRDSAVDEIVAELGGAVLLQAIGNKKGKRSPD